MKKIYQLAVLVTTLASVSACSTPSYDPFATDYGEWQSADTEWDSNSIGLDISKSTGGSSNVVRADHVWNVDWVPDNGRSTIREAPVKKARDVSDEW